MSGFVKTELKKSSVFSSPVTISKVDDIKIKRNVSLFSCSTLLSSFSCSPLYAFFFIARSDFKAF